MPFPSEYRLWFPAGSSPDDASAGVLARVYPCACDAPDCRARLVVLARWSLSLDQHGNNEEVCAFADMVCRVASLDPLKTVWAVRGSIRFDLGGGLLSSPATIFHQIRFGESGQLSSPGHKFPILGGHLHSPASLSFCAGQKIDPSVPPEYEMPSPRRGEPSMQ